jgi:hypothetical protein
MFVGAVLITGFTYAAIFAYLSGATYILQGMYGLSPQGYWLALPHCALDWSAGGARTVTAHRINHDGGLAARSRRTC